MIDDNYDPKVCYKTNTFKLDGKWEIKYIYKSTDKYEEKIYYFSDKFEIGFLKNNEPKRIYDYNGKNYLHIIIKYMLFKNNDILQILIF